jgi:hypothetical protein
MMDVADIYIRVLEERAHQDRKWGTIGTNPHDRGTWWLLIQAELDEAREALIKGSTDERNSWASELVQVAALCFAALEQHGFQVPDRGRGL